MELRHLRYFVAVAETENVSRAALKLHVSQPGLSRQIRDLEDEIAIQLFERSAKSLRLTKAGKIFLEEARDILERVDEAVRTTRASINGSEAEINVGYSPSLTVQILPQVLRKFQSKFRKVQIKLHDLSTGEMLVQLREQKLQIALMVRPDRRTARGFEFQEIARYPMCVAIAPRHSLARMKTITFGQIVGESLIAYRREEYPEYHGWVEGMFMASTGRKPNIAEEHDGVTSIIAAVESGVGFSLVPGSLAAMVGTRLKLIPLAEPTPEVVVFAVWRKDPLLPDPVRQFIATFERAAQ